MQDLLPVTLEELNLNELLEQVGTIIGEGVQTDEISTDAAHPIYICGRVKALKAPHAVVIIGPSGCVSGSVSAAQLVLFGRIEPPKDERCVIRAKEIITASGSLLSNCDVFYETMRTHSKAKTRKVTLDELEGQT